MPRLQLEQRRQQLRVVDFRAVGGTEIIARASVDPDAPALFGREAREREIFQIDEAVQEVAGGIDLYGEPSLGEVDLHRVCALFRQRRMSVSCLAQ